MARERENFCRLLGLNPLRESKYSQSEITGRINKKEADWKKRSQNPQTSMRKRFEASMHVEMIPEMRSVMSSPVLREAEFENGLVLLKSKASKLSKSLIILQDGSKYLPPGEADSQAKRLGWKDVRGSDLVKAFGEPLVDAPEPVPSDVDVARKNLDDVAESSPITLLNTLIENQALEIKINRLDEGCTNEQIRIAFEAVNSRLNHIKPGKIANQDAYIHAMRSLKMVLSPDEKLDTLIRYCACKDAMEPAQDTLDEDFGTPFTSEYLDKLVSIYAEDAPDPQMCVDILESYCCSKKYVGDFSGGNSSLTLCPSCKGMVYDLPENIFCPICGSALRHICPHCGMNQTVSNRMCGNCGRPLEGEIQNAKRTAAEVRKLAAVGNPVGAAEKLHTLVNSYPSYPENNDLTALVRKSERSLNEFNKRILDDYGIRRYYDLKTTVEEGLKRFPSLLDDKKLATMYREACDKAADADRLCINASAMTSDQALDIYIKAADRCPDHPDAVEKLKDYPPEGPADAVVQPREDTVLLRFAVPEDRRGTTFCVYRGRGGLPVVDNSSIPVAEVGGSIFQDKTVDPGVDYYYKIYSKRWGILSREFAQCGPVMVLREVSDAELTPIDDGLHIKYKAPKGCNRVRIWRKEGVTAAGTSAEIEVRHSGCEFNDRGLKGGCVYSYLFVAEYDVGNRSERSLGTVFTGKTIRFPAPVNDLDISWNRSDGSYTAKWSSREDVRLYVCKKKAKIFGTTIAMDDLESWMKKIEPVEIYDDGCRFELDDGIVAYIYPMIPIGETAVRGREIMIANLKPFRDVEKRMSGTDCDLTMTWPEGAEAAVAVISDTMNAEEDPTSENITVSREGYEADRKIRIHMGNSPKKTVRLHAVYEIDGEKRNSRSITLDIYSGAVNKIAYDVRLESVKGKRKDTEVVIDLECPDGKSIPRMVFVRTSEGIPLKARDGKTVFDSEGPVDLVDGKARMSFIMPKNEAAIERMRLFFVNLEDYNLYKFVHPLYKDRRR